MIPMGSVMAACMAIGTVFAARPLGVLRISPPWLVRAVAILLAFGGLWNAGWHAPRHITEFWGQAALGSGIAMLVVAALLLVPHRLPAWLNQLRPIAVLALAGFTCLYVIAIYRL